VIFHQTASTLSRYADGGLAGMTAKRVAAHLETCADCRAMVASYRELGASARKAAVPAMRGGVWERIAERRGGGERVILPVETAGARVVSRTWVAVAAAVVVIAAAVMTLPLTRGASAGELGRLTFAPALPKPGTTVSIVYAPIAALAEEPKLELLALYVTRAPYSVRNPNAPWRPAGRVVATLARQIDGRFTATLLLPDSLIYAVFSVSDPSGEIVDSDHRRLWELRTAGADGRPAFSSLLASADGTPQGGAMDPRANAAAESLVAIYPDSAQSWAVQMHVQGSSRVPHWLSVFDQRERRFAKLETSLAKRATISPAEMTAMARIAAMVEDTAAERNWNSRLIAAYPLDPRAITAMYWRTLQLPRDSARARLSVMDSVWNAAPQSHALVAEIGLDVALNAGDSAAIRLWVRRELAATEPGYLYWGLASYRDPEIRAAITASLRAQLDLLLNDSTPGRSLMSTRSRDRLYRQGLAAGVLGRLGQAMLLDKRYAAARDTLGIAIQRSEGFCGYAYLHRYRATVDLIMGDTAEAERDLAIGAAAKWSPSGPFGDSAAGMLGDRYQAARWNALVDSAATAAKGCSNWWAAP
jgi:hypothetical protein